MKKIPLGHIVTCIVVLPISLACMPLSVLSTPSPTAASTQTPTSVPPTDEPAITPSPAPTATPEPLVPDFDHIVIIMFENKEFGTVIGNSRMPVYNELARKYTLLTQYYAVTHPSLPNYIALIGGDTFDIDTNCNDCFVNAISLPDLIEASGRTWRTYQEDMPEPCYLGDTHIYVQKHNPFIYFDPIRTDATRCEQSIVDLDALQADIDSGSLPNFIFITPNLCNDAHDCPVRFADVWLEELLGRLVPALEAEGPSYLLVLLFEEGQGNSSCCDLPAEAGGRVPVVLYSPLAKNGFEDDTPYTHYSLLKTIATSWGLPLLRHAADEAQTLIIAPWE
jgi:hypothetical protein